MIKNKSFILTKKSYGQSGITLMLSILVLAAILSIAFSLATVTFVEIRSSGDLVRTEPTYYAADAISEAALFTVMRNVSDTNYPYDSSIGAVSLTTNPSFVSTAIFQATVPKTSYDFISTRSHFPIYDTQCVTPNSANSTNCPTGGSGYGRIKITYLDTGNTDHLKVFLCQFDPNKPVNPSGTWPTVYTSIPCSNPNDTSNYYWLTPAGGDDLTSGNTSNNVRETGTGSWSSINPNLQQELIFYNSGSTGDIHVQIEAFDTNGVAKGLPLVGSKAVDISASSQGVVRKIRTTIPVNNIGGSSGTASGFNHFRKITVNTGQVIGGPLLNFPVLVNITDPAVMATLLSGVTTSQGYDILFAQNLDGSGVLASEIERYNNSTGALTAWVKLPSLSDGTEFYMFYGKTGLAGFTNPPSDVWDSSNNFVWHLSESGGTIYDSTANARNGAKRNSNDPSQTTGLIGYGQNYDGNNAYTTLSVNVNEAEYTYSAWFNTSDTSGTILAVTDPVSTSASAHDRQFGIFSSGKLCHRVWNEETYCSAASVNNSSWHYGVVTVGSGGGKLYLDGNLVNFGAKSTSDFNWQTGVVSGEHSYWGAYTGDVDELRVANVQRTAGWIQTEYNNQRSGTSFYLIGPEQ